jgi:hypothetical protein
MHHLCTIYFVNQSLHVSGIFTAHHQEVFTVYIQQLVRVIRLRWLGTGEFQPDPASCQSTSMYQLLYIHSKYLLMMGNKHSWNMYRLFDEINWRQTVHLVGFHYKEYLDAGSANHKKSWSLSYGCENCFNRMVEVKVKAIPIQSLTNFRPIRSEDS